MQNLNYTVVETNLPLPLFIRGKVRDTYHLDDHLLIVTTDRISAFDVILPCGIPGKGKVLNQMSAFWAVNTSSLLPNHLVETVDNVSVLDKYLSPDNRFEYPAYLVGRSMIVRKAERLPVECVVRGYLAGSGWSEYQEKGSVCGVPIAAGFVESQQLPEPIFTPTTKAEQGHDMPMTAGELAGLVGPDMASQLAESSIAIYRHALNFALKKGFIIADTKFEFGLTDGHLTIIDEMLTPDSSRFWDINTYKQGRPQDSFDKQPVRDWLSRTGWNKMPPAPELPPEVIEMASKRYLEAFKKITGYELA